MERIIKLYIDGDIDINTMIDFYILYKRNKLKFIINLIKLKAQEI